MGNHFRSTSSGKVRLSLALALALVLTLPLTVAADPPKGMSPEEQAAMAAWTRAATPGPEHARMAHAVGEFDVTVKTYPDPAGEPEVATGTASREMILGGRVLKETMQATMMGQPYEGIGMTGYDNVTERFWSLWTDDMSTGLSVMYGTWNEDGSGEFSGEIPDAMSGGMTPMTIRMHTDGKREVHEFYAPGPGGEDVRMMELIYIPRKGRAGGASRGVPEARVGACRRRE